MKALDDIDIHSADRRERPHLVLAILELSFLMRGKGLTKRSRDGPAEIDRRLQRKQA